MIKKLLKIVISLLVISWVAKKMYFHHYSNGKQNEPLTAKLKRQMKCKKWWEKQQIGINILVACLVCC